MNWNPQHTEVIIRYRDGTVTAAEDAVVSEQPVTIKINREEFVTLVCTPEYIEDMVIGYLASEGIIERMDDVREMWVEEAGGFVHVTLKEWNPLYRKLFAKRYVTSCCGASRHGFVYVNDARTAKVLLDRQVQLSFADCFRLMEELQRGAELFRHTGGVHSAALCDAGGILLARSDIGRHNALDKIYGHRLRHGMSPDGQIIAFSGRISSEILLKAAKIGCAVVLSKSAPTALALELAEHLGITTVGFIRGHSCNVYTHPERISGCDPESLLH
ncbi:formate dehydrogenase accessory sulfurtransferase FdhD [Paenibacillus oralis]|uniref:Sulfur carrier protein FdhD n=1 Tax=Paenibacillus oralis TaxID=2490856 RepID=A0A3P3U3E1_9BACL|nr:formate dehydrogenase accessory sulfurtransferase FdhD [Paenibacillus oralis]RRJ64670.1 formate dehydrogenase accessory sulfurtransferase FdhD [Paenibacillus oralis]